MKTYRVKKDLKSIMSTIFELMGISKIAKKWFIIKCINGATMAVSWGIITRYIEYFTKAALDKDMELFKTTSLIYIVIVLFMVLTRFLGPFAGNRYGMYTIKEFRKNILYNVHNLKIDYFDNKHSGDTITKLSNDVSIVENFISYDMTTLFGYLPGGLIYSMSVLFLMNVKLTLILLPIIVLTTVYSMKYWIKTKEISNKRQKYISKANMILRDILENVSIVKIYNLDKYFYNKYDDNIIASQNEENKIYKNNRIISIIGYFTRMIPLIAAYIFGVIFISKGQLSVPQLIAYTALTMLAFGHFSMLYGLFSNCAKMSGAMDHIKEITTEIKERTDGLDFFNNISKYAFEMKDVSFMYNDEIKVIHEMSFKIKKGETVAFVGESGCGKSTLVKLLLSYYETYSGEIFVNGKEIKEWNLQSLRSNFSYVSQDDYLFSDSIRNNIMYGKISASDKQFEQVCKIAGIDEIVDTLENGYDTLVGERGCSLSGGQRQRITLARAILADNRYILLDEPTSNLDTKSEFYIEKAIQNLKGSKTIIIIAHRLSTIINCDDILVMKHGKVIEHGKHEILINQRGEYYRLYNKQNVV